MTIQVEKPRFHIDKKEYHFTPDGTPRGYIKPGQLKELWFHTGTACNLSCSFCLEGSGPGDKRLGEPTLEEVKPLMDEAVEMGVERFSFTGGEPFVNPAMVSILDYALEKKPCHVLTNGTHPVQKKMPQLVSLAKKPNSLSFRISLDDPDPEKHDRFRGKGNFMRAVQTMGELHKMGFHVSIARQERPGENVDEVNRMFHPHFKSVGLGTDVPIVVFPDFLPPNSINNKIPDITEGCITQYKDDKSREAFMCHFSRMVVKKGGKMAVYACTLVDDDTDYDLGPSVKESMTYTVRLKHHRCYSCFAFGASCSET